MTNKFCKDGVNGCSLCSFSDSKCDGQGTPHDWVRDALNDDWLFSVFHPIVDSQSGKVFAYEALIRARNPESGQIIGAGQIIESCGHLKLEHQLDKKARRCAIACAAELRLPMSTRFFINFLPNTIYDPVVCLRTTMEAAEEFDIGLDRLVFEVVETEKIADMKRLKNILNYYRARGARVAVDDMGAGYTSVDYLTSLRPDFVKMDREVVVNAAKNDVDRVAFRSIVKLAHDLAIKVVAEGIETEDQMQVCQEVGVDYLQGFLFARPANPPEIASTTLFADRLKAA